MSELTDVRIALGQMTVAIQNLTSHVVNVDTKMDGLQTRREADVDKENLDERLKKVERAQEKAAWAIIGAWIAGIGSIIGRKTGLIP